MQVKRSATHLALTIEREGIGIFLMVSMQGLTTIRKTFALLLLVGVASVAVAQQDLDPATRQVWLGDDLAVSYAARIEGEWLIVEVLHEPGWHTYAMDNVLRAAELAGSARPDTELPTQVTPSPGIEVAQPWRQTVPTELSQPDIRWYTWGFEDRSFFAARLVRADPGGWVQVDAQACTERLCAMVDGLRVPVTRSSGRSVDPGTLAVVRSAGGEAAGMDAIREQLVEFGDWFQRAIDIECSGRVSVARLVEILNPPRDQPHRIDWDLALDADGDGFVEPGEVGIGMWENHLGYQIERPMLGDVDGDGVLTPREYALMVPDPGAETNEEWLSERQEARFAVFDRNGDRRVSPDELAAFYARRGISFHWSEILLFHLGRTDADGDGAVTREELTTAIEAAGGAVAPGALDVWFETARDAKGETSVPRLMLSQLPALLRKVGMTADGRATFEAPLRPLLAPPCGSSASGSH